MRIPDEKIDEVRGASDIVDVISAYVQLKKRGKSFLGRCPFHQEKTPSFSVSPEKQMYYCFGCGAGGNVFTFLMQHDRVSFLEAVRMLAERSGIALPADDPAAQAQATEHEVLYNACRLAGLFFYDMLTHSPEGKIGLTYFQGRGFSDETIKRFGLGYSLNSWDGFLQHATREGVDVAVLERAGLVVKKEDGSKYYDRFRGRAMFPIISAFGRVIAFGARKLRDDDPLAKYVNSPETPIYNKSRTLYGLSQAKDAIREKDFTILVEGYADLITVAQAGIRNIVASSGTALTEEQIRLIDRYTKNITLVYDADSAGSKAMLRGVDLIIEQGLDVRVIELPEGEDPDSFVKKNGGEEFETMIAKAESFLDFKANYFRRLGMLSSAEGKTRAIRSIVGTIARMKDELKRTVYVQALAEKYSLPETLLYRELETTLGGVRNEARRHAVSPASRVEPAPTVSQPLPPRQIPAVEKNLLKVMLDHGDEVIRFVFSRVDPVMFHHPVARTIAERLHAMVSRNQSFEPSALVDALPDDEVKRVVSELLVQSLEIAPEWKRMKADPKEPDPWKMAEDSVVSMLVRELDLLHEEAHRVYKEAGARGEDTRELYEKLMRLKKESMELRTNGLPPEPGA